MSRRDETHCSSCEGLRQQLFDVRQLLHLLMENNPFCIFWKDENLVYRGCNQRFAALAGCASTDAVTGKTDFDMPWGVDNEVGAEACRSSDRRVLESGVEEMHIIEQIMQENGQVVWTDTSKVPIRDPAGRVVGLLGTLEDITPRKLIEEALEKANNELIRLRRMDSLTQLANRRHFGERLEQEWSRATREHTAVTFLLFDVDRFKAFNDNYGHLAGDECLRLVAEATRASLRRATDLAARYGGEEFIVLLPGLGLEQAKAIAEALRQRVETLRVAVDGRVVGVTASFGVTCCLPEVETSPLTSIAAADRALYQAKSLGRNCVVASEDRDLQAKGS